MKKKMKSGKFDFYQFWIGGLPNNEDDPEFLGNTPEITYTKCFGRDGVVVKNLIIPGTIDDKVLNVKGSRDEMLRHLTDNYADHTNNKRYRVYSFFVYHKTCEPGDAGLVTIKSVNFKGRIIKFKPKGCSLWEIKIKIIGDIEEHYCL